MCIVAGRDAKGHYWEGIEMDTPYTKHQAIRLRATGRDERWLQERINEDPAILGLGELEVWRKERTQNAGGRLDFLLQDPDTDLVYEVEVMLGATDESHIIRTIEYWDNERRRFPNRDHRAVIVAEEITNRFFNIVWLLNRAIPIIAIQMNALIVEGKLVLNFTKVLDIYEPQQEDEEEASEIADRSYWERKASSDSVKFLDEVQKAFQVFGFSPKIKYRRDMVVMVGARNNFGGIYLRKNPDNSGLRLWPRSSDVAIVRARLDEAGLVPTVRKDSSLALRLTRKILQEHGRDIADAARLADESRNAGIGTEGLNDV